MLQQQFNPFLLMSGKGSWGAKVGSSKEGFGGWTFWIVMDITQLNEPLGIVENGSLFGFHF